jgi:hypothetical protein
VVADLRDIKMYMLLLRHAAIGIAVTSGLFVWAWLAGDLNGRGRS